MIESAKARVRIAKAKLAFSEADTKRYEYRTLNGSGTIKTQQRANITLLQNRGSFKGTEAALEAVQAHSKSAWR